ncbi:sensor histidine kinase [Candidatus Omnitrophota bacterium]
MDTVMTVYVVTVVIGVTIALLLTRAAKSTSQPKIEFEGRLKKEEYQPSNIPMHASLRHTIFEEIKEEVSPIQRCQEITGTLSGIFTKELEKERHSNMQEFDKKYTSLTQNAEISWAKYKKVLSDQKTTGMVMRSVAEGLVVLDTEGNVIMMNSAAEGLLGVSKKDILERRLSDKLKKELLVTLVKDSSGGVDKEIKIISQDDETKRVLRSSNAVVEDENGKIIGMISVLSDITKQKKLDQLKSNFVSNVTHELRTPLVSTQKAISMLLSEERGQISEEKQKQFLSLADRNLKRLSILIDDILDISKIEAGKMELKRKMVSVGKLIDESIEGLDAWTRAKSIKIERRIQEDIPKVNVDSDRIIQVLNNLIGNAVKFTPENGAIAIEAILENDRDVKVSIQDTGIGIDRESIPKVFDRFYQAGERSVTDINGTGIGLSIAKEIIELHGGRIWVDAERDKGACFNFRLEAI